MADKAGDVRLLTFRVLRNRTISSVFCMSGILSLSPVVRRRVLSSMN